LIAEFSRGKDQDAVLGSTDAALQADNYAMFDSRLILRQRSQTSEMIRRNPGRSFCFYRQLHIISLSSASIRRGALL
jgi:hypothetical protein